jgi:hypothetical protein
MEAGICEGSRPVPIGNRFPPTPSAFIPATPFTLRKNSRFRAQRDHRFRPVIGGIPANSMIQYVQCWSVSSHGEIQERSRQLFAVRGVLSVRIREIGFVFPPALWEPGKRSRPMSQRFQSVVMLAILFSAVPLSAETLPSGTKMVVRLDKDIEPDGKTKQKFSASLASSVFVDGREVVPLGSRIVGDVRGSKKTVVLSPNSLILPNGQKIDFYASVEGISNKSLEAQSKEGTIERKGDTGGAVQQAGEMGTTGAVIGAISTGTLEGAGIGAAAGVGAVIIGRKVAGMGKTTVIPAGARITLSLNRPVEIPDNAADAKAPEPQFSNREDQRPILRREEPQQTPPAGTEAP